MLKPRKMVFGVVLLLLFVGPAFAQSVDTAWVRRYNVPGSDWGAACAIAVAGSGNVHVTGKSWGSQASYDFTTIKYYSNGDTAWVRTYNAPGNDWDEPHAIAVDSSGNVYVTGWSKVGGTEHDRDYTTIKYDSSGNELWVRTYKGSANDWDEAYAVAVDDSGYVYVTGESRDNVTDSDYATIKYYPSGDTAWVRRYTGEGGDGWDKAYAMTVDHLGNVYVTGYSEAAGINFDYATIKYYPNGDTAWVRRYNGLLNGWDKGWAITVDGSGNVYVTGESQGSEATYNFTTIKYDASGNELWVKAYYRSGSLIDRPYGIAVDGSGNVYVTGESYDSESNYDYATIKYYPNGDTAWVRRYNGPANGWDGAYAMAVDDSGSVYVTGHTGWSADADYATIKYYPNGDTAWVRMYDGPGNGVDNAYAIAVDHSRSVYVTGASEGIGTSWAFATIKYVQTASYVQDETGSRERPSEFELSQNYPNPFNPSTEIEFALAKSGFVTLQIYDILGRKVRTLVSEELPSGCRSVVWDGKNDDGQDVVSGVYFYQLRVGDFSEPKKMVLLK